MLLFFQETLNHRKQLSETVLYWEYKFSVVILSLLSYHSSRYWVGWMILNKIVTWNIEVTGVGQC